MLTNDKSPRIYRYMYTPLNFPLVVQKEMIGYFEKAILCSEEKVYYSFKSTIQHGLKVLIGHESRVQQPQ